MSFFQEQQAAPTDMASRIGNIIGTILVVVAYLIVIYPVVNSFLR